MVKAGSNQIQLTGRRVLVEFRFRMGQPERYETTGHQR